MLGVRDPESVKSALVLAAICAKDPGRVAVVGELERRMMNLDKCLEDIEQGSGGEEHAEWLREYWETRRRFWDRMVSRARRSAETECEWKLRVEIERDKLKAELDELKSELSKEGHVLSLENLVVRMFKLTRERDELQAELDTWKPRVEYVGRLYWEMKKEKDKVEQDLVIIQGARDSFKKLAQKVMSSTRKTIERLQRKLEKHDPFKPVEEEPKLDICDQCGTALGYEGDEDL